MNNVLVIAVRHGYYDVEKLTPRGEEEARAAASSIRALGLTKLEMYTSQAPRAVGTAMILGEELDTKLDGYAVWLNEESPPNELRFGIESFRNGHGSSEAVILVTHSHKVLDLIFALASPDHRREFPIYINYGEAYLIDPADGSWRRLKSEGGNG